LDETPPPSLKTLPLPKVSKSTIWAETVATKKKKDSVSQHLAAFWIGIVG
tara:strand:- start:1185 stop:1334 length:150 start_codon:yes stop_codon:yes gene_type:complete